jgi:hypothetical protein
VQRTFNTLQRRILRFVALITISGCRLSILNAQTGSTPNREEPAPTGPNIVVLAMYVEIDQVAPQNAKMSSVGTRDRMRIAYDKTKVDPVTHKVPIVYLGHYLNGMWTSVTPTNASSLDLSSVPHKLDFEAAVVHGTPIDVVFEGADQRLTILSRPDFQPLISGRYTIDPAPLTAEQIAAPPP